MDDDLTVRPLTPADVDLLSLATLENLNWLEQRFTAQDVENQSSFRHYTRMIRERGDFGVVAELAGEQVGVAWAQFLPVSDPGYGFVDGATPEVSLWVRDRSRGQGLGRALLRRLKSDAVDRGLRRLSLSVEAGNYARALYVSEGFVPVVDREDDGVMLWTDEGSPRHSRR